MAGVAKATCESPHARPHSRSTPGPRWHKHWCRLVHAQRPPIVLRNATRRNGFPRARMNARPRGEWARPRIRRASGLILALVAIPANMRASRWLRPHAPPDSAHRANRAMGGVRCSNHPNARPAHMISQPDDSSTALRCEQISPYRCKCGAALMQLRIIGLWRTRCYNDWVGVMQCCCIQGTYSGSSPSPSALGRSRANKALTSGTSGAS